MGLIRHAQAAAVACLAIAVLPLAAHADDEDADRGARWKQLQESIFPHRQIQDGGGIISVDAPPRALDAALVPVELQISGNHGVKGVYLIIDDNPAPLAAHFVFGPKADPHDLKLRVRVNQYTNIHAIAETTDGHLYASTKFVKASGGCSAPAGSDDAAALQDIGRMKLRLLSAFSAGKPVQAQLMIRHPNFNGMQMNQITRFYTPARFIRTIDATYNGGQVFHMDADISLSTDPVITFGFVPHEKGQMKVVALDSNNTTFNHSFDLPGS
ncbi:MAG TPA: quinoprotein dehydrogenase-associated SoxYZ-like carrier [Steroidobacteraceae bacterium]|nr:quinoprotein dehydrogenase-associated SoxYZ-like carrier [Steroidobacteraceae bacterium]